MTGPNTPLSTPLKSADILAADGQEFDLRPTPDDAAKVAAHLGIVSVSKLSFRGRLRPSADGGLHLTAHLGATVTQPCVVTFAPVRTRIETDVERRFLPGYEINEDDHRIDADDDVVLALTDTIDIGAIAVEEVALALPDYPRADGATLDQSTFAAPGVTPLSDEASRPFAGLAALRDKLAGDK